MILRQYLHTGPVIGATDLFGCAGHGAEYVLHAFAETRFPFRAVKEGDLLPLGNVEARVLHVPGHTPEHLALLVTDRTRGPEPWFVLTGHTLMVPPSPERAGEIRSRNLGCPTPTDV
ncbi:MAG: hypothetical protein AB7R55_12165 [Gemmatimonadales bacterium]